MLSYVNLNYFLMLFTLVNITVIISLFLRNRSEKFNYLFIFGILLSGFILHFSKLQFEPYRSKFPYSIRYLTFENVCAVSTILFPWFYLSKSKLLKDYIIVIGLFSGAGAVLVPYKAAGLSNIGFDIIRFYYAHYILFLAPFLMLYTKQYSFNIKGIFKVPLILYAVFAIILLNEVVLLSLGIVNGDINSLLNPNTRNGALIFGPNKSLQEFGWIFEPFVPEIFKTIPFGANAGQPMYWPIIWLIIPSYFYICLGGVIVDLLFVKLRKPKHSLNTDLIELRDSEMSLSSN